MYDDFHGLTRHLTLLGAIFEVSSLYFSDEQRISVETGSLATGPSAIKS